MNDYYRQTNEVLGVLSVSLGLSCIGTQNQMFFASIAGVFILIVWLYQMRDSNSKLALLTGIGHPEARTFRILLRAWPGLIGCVFLCLVAFGFLDRQGINFQPSHNYCLRANAEASKLGLRCEIDLIKR